MPVASEYITVRLSPDLLFSARTKIYACAEVEVVEPERDQLAPAQRPIIGKHEHQFIPRLPRTESLDQTRPGRIVGQNWQPLEHGR